MDRQTFMALAEEAIHFHNQDGPPEAGGMDHVIFIAESLRGLVDAEVRHLTLTSTGLVATLARLYTECVCALRGRRIEQHVVGQAANDVATFLYDTIFVPKNEKFGDSFRDFGAIGVVVRLLDQQRVLQMTQAPLALAHIANYAIMALALLREP
jgi:hypothetical protein